MIRVTKVQTDQTDKTEKPENKNVDVVEPRLKPDWEDFIEAYKKEKFSNIPMVQKSNYESHIPDPKDDDHWYWMILPTILL